MVATAHPQSIEAHQSTPPSLLHSARRPTSPAGPATPRNGRPKDGKPSSWGGTSFDRDDFEIAPASRPPPTVEKGAECPRTREAPSYLPPPSTTGVGRYTAPLIHPRPLIEAPDPSPSAACRPRGQHGAWYMQQASRVYRSVAPGRCLPPPAPASHLPPQPPTCLAGFSNPIDLDRPVCVGCVGLPPFVCVYIRRPFVVCGETISFKQPP